MSFCSSVKSFSQRHPWISDLFSLCGVAILFAGIWFAIAYSTEILLWVRENPLFHTPLLVAACGGLVAVLLGFLSLGSSGDAEQGCFHTFRGRLHGGPSLGSVFHNWLQHMENVGKKHR
jgi:hypothetical protein